MGKWGLISYRLSALLLDSKETSASHKQMVAATVALELARQWFGHLVTMVIIYLLLFFFTKLISRLAVGNKPTNIKIKGEGNQPSELAVTKKNMV